MTQRNRIGNDPTANRPAEPGAGHSSWQFCLLLRTTSGLWSTPQGGHGCLENRDTVPISGVGARGGSHRRRAARLQAMAVLLFSVGSVGCFTFTPVVPGAVSPVEDVRVVLDRAAVSRVEREFGTASDRLMGRLELQGPDSILVSAWVGQAFSGTRFSQARQPILLHRSEVLEIHRRSLSVRRTALTVLGATGIVAILVSRLAQGEADPGEDPEPPPPPPPPGGLIRR